MAKTRKSGRHTRRASGKNRGMYHRPKPTIPLAMVAGVVPLLGGAVNEYRVYSPQGMGVALRQSGNFVLSRLTGYDPIAGVWSASYLRQGALPLFLAYIAHRIIGGMFGINAMLSRARVPWLRI